MTSPVWHIPMPVGQEESVPLTYAGSSLNRREKALPSGEP
jgi:hypothetical protein